MNSQSHKISYQKLMNYAVNNFSDWTVHESDIDCWDSKTKTILNNKKRTPENRVIYFSHEIGHVSIYKKFNKKYGYSTIFPGFEKNANEKSQQISELEQEILAWDEGLNIIQKLEIPISIKRYAKIKTMCLKTYLPK